MPQILADARPTRNELIALVMQVYAWTVYPAVIPIAGFEKGLFGRPDKNTAGSSTGKRIDASVIATEASV